jgi:hypothetical protein
MTSPFETVVGGGAGGEKRDPNSFLNWKRVAEIQTPRGLRPGKLLVVRPLKVIDEFRKEERDKWLAKGTWVPSLTVADIACLDVIEPMQDEYGMPVPGFEAGHQFRDQVVFPGYLNKAFAKYVGKTLIGVTYEGENTKGKPPIMFRDLSGDPGAVSRGQRFLAARPEFLVPVEAQFVEAAPEQWNGASGYQGNPNAPQQGSRPVMYTQHDPTPQQQYQQPDPWAQASNPVSAQPVSPAQTAPSLSTLDQLRQANQVNAQGQPQSDTPPF